MTKQNGADMRGQQGSPGGSGSYPAVENREPGSSEVTAVGGQESSVIGTQRDIWERVAWWLTQLPDDDSRKRTLQLAELRRDIKLAEVVLRHL